MEDNCIQKKILNYKPQGKKTIEKILYIAKEILMEM
jgi:hypothetical protein